MQNEQLLGTWKLISIEARSSNDEVIYPYGQDPFGRLMYDASGYMSVLLMRPNRPKFASGDMASGTPREIKAAFEGFDAYCGTYEVDAEKGTVTHHVEGSKFPNWVGTHQVRFFEFSDDRLLLNSPPILIRGEKWTAHGIFERAE